MDSDNRYSFFFRPGGEAPLSGVWSYPTHDLHYASEKIRELCHWKALRYVHYIEYNGELVVDKILDDGVCEYVFCCKCGHQVSRPSPHQLEQCETLLAERLQRRVHSM